MTDLKNILHEVIEEINGDENELDLKNNPNVKVHKKPIQLKEIEKRSKTSNLNNLKSENEINKLIDLEKDKIYNQLWTRLDTGSRINRIKLYIDTIIKDEYALTEQEIGKTMIVVSHDMSIISKCDKTYRVKDSGIIIDS